MVYPTAEKTASMSKRIPGTDALKEKSLFIITSRTPTIENNIPIIFKMEILSRKMIKAAHGTNKGIVAIKTAPSVDDTKSRPYVSPIKYNKGSKKVISKNHFKSFFLMFSNIPSDLVRIKRKITETTSLDKIRVIGDRFVRHILVPMNENPQKIMARTRLV